MLHELKFICEITVTGITAVLAFFFTQTDSRFATFVNHVGFEAILMYDSKTIRTGSIPLGFITYYQCRNRCN